MIHIEVDFFFVSETSYMEEMAAEWRKIITQGRENVVDGVQLLAFSGHVHLSIRTH